MRRMWTRLVIVLSVLGGAHAYIWWRLVDVPRLPMPWFAVATVAIIAIAPSLPVGVFAIRGWPRAPAAPYRFTAYALFGLSVYMLVAAGVSHVATAAGADARTAALVAAAGAVAITLYGMVHLARGPRVRRVDVPLSKLAPSATGYTIVHLTDLHIGPLLGRGFAEAVVAKVNALEPDVVVLTGDIVDGRVDEMQPHVEPLRALRAKHGVYAVTGNHEYYWSVDHWIAHLGSLGIRVLRNERVAIGDAVELAGVDDVTAAAMAVGHGEDIPRAAAGRDPARPLVLLAHHPRSIARAQAAGVDLQLSGHTHGGQLLPLGWLSRLFEPRVAGLARFGATWLYVSQGTGFWGPPLRVGTTSEIALLTLRPA